MKLMAGGFRLPILSVEDVSLNCNVRRSNCEIMRGELGPRVEASTKLHIFLNSTWHQSDKSRQKGRSTYKAIVTQAHIITLKFSESGFSVLILGTGYLEGVAVVPATSNFIAAYRLSRGLCQLPGW